MLWEARRSRENIMVVVGKIFKKRLRSYHESPEVSSASLCGCLLFWRSP